VTPGGGMVRVAAAPWVGVACDAAGEQAESRIAINKTLERTLFFEILIF